MQAARARTENNPKPCRITSSPLLGASAIASNTVSTALVKLVASATPGDQVGLVHGESHETGVKVGLPGIGGVGNKPCLGSSNLGSNEIGLASNLDVVARYARTLIFREHTSPRTQDAPTQGIGASGNLPKHHDCETTRPSPQHSSQKRGFPATYEFCPRLSFRPSVGRDRGVARKRGRDTGHAQYLKTTS